jgi:hypothetical protein
MNQTLHIIGKDLRRLRWLVLAWALVVLADTALETAGPALAFGGGEMQAIVDSLSQLVALIQMLLLVLLVSGIVHEDPLVGADAFWLTRPIDRRALMSAKLLSAAAVLMAVPLAGELIAMKILHADARDLVRAAPVFALSQAGWVLVLMAVAALTPSLTRLLLVIGGGIAAIAVAVSVAATVLLSTEPDLSTSVLPDMTSAIVQEYLLLLVSAAVIIYQYRTRRLRRAVVLGVAGIVAAVTIAAMWPWRFAKPAEPDPGASARDISRTVAVIGGEPPQVSDMFSLRRDRMRKQVAAPLHLTGLAPDYSVDSATVRAHLDFPGGATLRSAQTMMAGVRRESTGAAWDPTVRMQAALGNVRLASTDDGRYTQWPIVLIVSEPDYERYGYEAGRLRLDVDFHLYRSRLAGLLPLTDGASLRAGAMRFEVVRVVRRGDGCSVLLRESFVPSLSFSQRAGTRSFQIALLNASKREATLGNNEYMSNRGMHVGNWSFQPVGAVEPVFSHSIAMHYPARAPFSAADFPIDAAWLADAQLAVIETAYAGRVARSLTIDGFRMRR